MESWEHARRDYDVRAHARKHARMLACMHTILKRAQAHISANWGRIGKIKISTESGEHADRDYDVRAHARKHARMLACMHTMLWRAQAHISANLGWIGKIDIYGIVGTCRL